MALTHPTGVTAGTLAGPWAYNDFQSLLTGGMTDQPVTIANSVTVNQLTLAGGSYISWNSGQTSLGIRSQQSGAANGVYVATWNGTALVVPFSFGGQYDGAKAWADNLGFVNATGGFGASGTGFYFNSSRTDPTSDTSWGVKASNTAGTLDFVSTSGFRFIPASGSAYAVKFSVDGSGNLTAANINGNAVFAQGAGSSLNSINLGPTALGANLANFSLDTTGHFLNFWAPTPSGTAYSIDFHPWNGTGNVTALHLDSSGYVNFGVIRNGTPQLNKIYTGGNTPANPAVGDMWAGA